MMTRALQKMTPEAHFKGNGFPRPRELTIMTWPLSSLWGRGLKEAVSDVFTEVTGIRIRHIENVGLDFPVDFLRALKNNRRPPFDVVYANSIPALKLAQAGFCDPFDEGEFPVLRELGDRARPEAKGVSGWPIVNVYIVRYALMYRHAAFLEGPPESWNVMTDPTYKRRVSLYPGGKGFYAVAQVIAGGSLDGIPDNMEPCWSFIRSLKSQIGPIGYSPEMTGHVREGIIDLFFTALTNIRQWKHDGFRVSWSVPREGTTDCTDALFVPKYLPENVAFWAKTYVAYALTKEAQKSFCHRLGVCSTHPAVGPPSDLVGDPACAQSADDLTHVLYVPDSVTVEHEESWMERFNEILLRT